MEAAGALASEASSSRGCRCGGLTYKRRKPPKHWIAVLIKNLYWYWPKSLIYHLFFKPLYLPSLRYQCQYVMVEGGKVRLSEHHHGNLPPKPAGTVRLVCVSDTHDRFQDLGVPPGDVLIHAGDLVFKGGSGRRDYLSINRHLRTLLHPIKLVIVGNHDWWVDSKECSKEGFKRLMSNAVYLEDDEITLPAPPGTGGSAASSEVLRVYGSPRTPLGTSDNVAFQFSPEVVKPWDHIPFGLDVLITHATPAGHAEGLGDPLLRQAIDVKRPRVHVCGHDHAAYGASLLNGHTLVLNPSMVDDTFYYPTRVPLVYDLPVTPTIKTTT